jgi:hypothetical protein
LKIKRLGSPGAWYQQSTTLPDDCAWRDKADRKERQDLVDYIVTASHSRYENKYDQINCTLNHPLLTLRGTTAPESTNKFLMEWPNRAIDRCARSRLEKAFHSALDRSQE